MKRILFANIGWMINYQGNTDTDHVKGAGSYSDAHKHEVYNFKKVAGYYYGYVQPAIDSINLKRIDPRCSGDVLEDVLVVWMAPFEGTKSRHIVGWYWNATVYRYVQPDPKGTRSGCGYFIKARAGDCTLLPVAERTFQIPKAKDFSGQKNVWYADSDNPEVVRFRNKVWKYIDNYSVRSAARSTSSPKVNVRARKEVERKAVDFVSVHFISLGYKVKSVEKANKGWDLEAEKDDIKLLLEVKGLAGKEISVHITQNEYEKMKSHKNNYFLCVVTNVMESPTLYTFEWNEKSGSCVSNDGKNLQLTIDLIPTYIARVE